MLLLYATPESSFSLVQKFLFSGKAEEKSREIDSIPFPMKSLKALPFLGTSERLRQRGFH